MLLIIMTLRYCELTMYSILTSRNTVWRLYFAGLNFRELLFENISLKKFHEFAVKRHVTEWVWCTILHLREDSHAR